MKTLVITDTSRMTKKILAVKLYRELTGASLSDATSAIESQPPIVVGVFDDEVAFRAEIDFQKTGCATDVKDFSLNDNSTRNNAHQSNHGTYETVHSSRNTATDDLSLGSSAYAGHTGSEGTNYHDTNKDYGTMPRDEILPILNEISELQAQWRKWNGKIAALQKMIDEKKPEYDRILNKISRKGKALQLLAGVLEFFLAAILAMFGPVGIVLGIITFLVLLYISEKKIAQHDLQKNRIVREKEAAEYHAANIAPIEKEMESAKELLINNL